MSASIPKQELARIEEAVRQGRKIEAIKLYRECTGAGLAEAKAAVENMEATPQPVPGAPPKTGEALAGVEDALFQGQKLLAIKQYRQATGAGLAEAKMAVEKMEAELRSKFPERFSSPPARNRCLGMVATACVFLAVIVFWIARS